MKHIKLFEQFILEISVIFNDLKLPIDLEILVFRSTYEDFKNGNTKFILENLDLLEKSEQIFETYWTKYSNSNLSSGVLSILQNK